MTFTVECFFQSSHSIGQVRLGSQPKRVVCLRGRRGGWRGVDMITGLMSTIADAARCVSIMMEGLTGTSLIGNRGVKEDVATFPRGEWS